MLKRIVVALGIVLMVGVWAQAKSAASEKSLSAVEVNQRLSPGINYGNVLEADPPEGWGLKVEEKDFKVIADAGFKSVRIPVRWSAKSLEKAPYTIDPAFFALVDRAVNAAMANKLYTILNIHHFQALFDDPSANQERLLALWKQIARHYSKYPENLIFEIMNEPNNKLSTQLWNPMYKLALKEIRKSNPTRLVVVEGGDWGGASGLAGLTLPEKDSRLIFSFHDYTPMKFTHQGASWVGAESKKWLGTKWTGTDEEKNEIRRDFEKARDFQKQFNVPIYLGEFGSYREGDQKSRETWDANMVKMAQEYGFSYAYWNFKDEGFGAYDTKAGKWNEGIKAALLQAQK